MLVVPFSISDCVALFDQVPFTPNQRVPLSASKATITISPLDKAEALASAFGVDVSGGANDTEKLELFLTKLQAQNAKEILGEAGKTISDADRALVASIVGNVGLLSNRGQLQEKLNQLYGEIIVKKEQQILDALSSLDRYTGRNVASLLGSSGTSEEDEAERIAGLKALGIDPDG